MLRGVEGAEEPGEGDEHASQAEPVQDGDLPGHRLQPGHIRDQGHTRSQLKHQSGHACREPLLADAHPYHGCSLHRPGGGNPPVLESKRNGQGGESDGDGQERLRKEVQFPEFSPDEKPGRRQVESPESDRAQGSSVFVGTYQHGLLHEGDDGGAENDAAVHVPLEIGRLTGGEKDRNGRIEKKEKDEKEFRGCEMFRRIGVVSPEGADAEGKHKARQVEHAPCSEPGNGQDARIQHRVVAEEHHMAALTRGRKQRSEEPAHHTENGEAQRVLKNGQDRGKSTDRHQDREDKPGGQKFIESKRRENHQVEDADPAALEREGVVRPFDPEAPPDDEKRHGPEGGPDEAGLDGEELAVRRVLHEKGDAHEKNDQSRPDQQVAPGEKA